MFKKELTGNCGQHDTVLPCICSSALHYLEFSILWYRNRVHYASWNIFGCTDHVSPSMQKFWSKCLEFSLIFYIPFLILKTLQHTPHGASHWIRYHFCYFAALLKLHCPITKPWPLFAATLFSLCQVKSPSSPLGFISAGFPQLLICFCASVIPGLNVHLFTTATSWSCFLWNRTPFWGEAIILAVGIYIYGACTTLTE